MNAILGRASAALFVAAIGAAWPARADVVDPSMPKVVSVGAPRGAAPSDRFDPRRTGRARTTLPSRPIEAWRRRLAGTMEVSPIVDDAGNVYAAVTPGDALMKLSPEGRDVWRAPLGAPASAAPLLLSDGSIAVVTGNGAVWCFTPSGSLRFVSPSGISRSDVAPLALSSGGLLIAGGAFLAELDADGVLRARSIVEERTPGAAAPVPERLVGAVVDAPGGALITTSVGAVYRFRPPAPPKKIGSLGGHPGRGALLADERTLIAVVDGKRVVALDLPTGTTHARSSGFAFDAPPSVGPGGLVFTSTLTGLLLGIDSAGNERVHLSLDRPPPLAAPGAILTAAPPADLKPSPPLAIDATGRVAFVRGNGRAGLVTPEGKIDLISDRVCGAPLAVVPAGEKRLLIACRDGGLWMYGE